MQAFPFADLGKLSLQELSDLLNALQLLGEARSSDFQLNTLSTENK